MLPRQQWFDLLRLQLRQQHGKKTGACEERPEPPAVTPCRCQLTRIWREDRTRSSVAMPLEWKTTNATAILWRA